MQNLYLFKKKNETTARIYNLGIFIIYTIVALIVKKLREKKGHRERNTEMQSISFGLLRGKHMISSIYVFITGLKAEGFK